MEKIHLQHSYEDYCKEKDRFDIHKNITEYCNTISKNEYDIPHILFYGPPGSGKYSQALHFIRNYSPSALKYERKMLITYDKQEYIHVISDIHYEIDMELLGCNSKGLFQEMMKNIKDIIMTKQERFGIVLCKNFHMIHPELLDIFYSYMSNNEICNIKIIIITENISFIPDNIINISKIISIEYPNKTSISKITTIKNEKISNLKVKNKNEITNINQNIVKKIISIIIDFESYNMSIFREKIYDILVYNINIYDALYDIIYYLIENDYIDKDKQYDLMIHVYKVLKQYNNNYRPIFHLENICYYLISIIHDK